MDLGNTTSRRHIALADGGRWFSNSTVWQSPWGWGRRRLALWMWGSGTLKKLWGVPSGLIALVLCVTTVLCKSVNAIVLVIFGSIVYVLNKSLKTALPIVFLALLPPVYMYLRITGSFSGEALVTLTGQTINEDRAQSMEFRLVNEKLLLD